MPMRDARRPIGRERPPTDGGRPLASRTLAAEAPRGCPRVHAGGGATVAATLADDLAQREVPMDPGDHRGTLSDRSSGPLHRAGTDIADGEDARHAGLERCRRRPARHGRRGARQDVAVGIDCDSAALQPMRLRVGADEKKEIADLAIVRYPIVPMALADARQAGPSIAANSAQPRPEQDFDLGAVRDAVDQIRGH